MMKNRHSTWVDVHYMRPKRELQPLVQEFMYRCDNVAALLGIGSPANREDDGLVDFALSNISKAEAEVKRKNDRVKQWLDSSFLLQEFSVDGSEPVHTECYFPEEVLADFAELRTPSSHSQQELESDVSPRPASRLPSTESALGGGNASPTISEKERLSQHEKNNLSNLQLQIDLSAEVPSSHSREVVPGIRVQTRASVHVEPKEPSGAESKVIPRKSSLTLENHHHVKEMVASIEEHHSARIGFAEKTANVSTSSKQISRAELEAYGAPRHFPMVRESRDDSAGSRVIIPSPGDSPHQRRRGSTAYLDEISAPFQPPPAIKTPRNLVSFSRYNADFPQAQGSEAIELSSINVGPNVSSAHILLGRLQQEIREWENGPRQSNWTDHIPAQAPMPEEIQDLQRLSRSPSTLSPTMNGESVSSSPKHSSTPQIFGLQKTSSPCLSPSSASNDNTTIQNVKPAEWIASIPELNQISSRQQRDHDPGWAVSQLPPGSHSVPSAEPPTGPPSWQSAYNSAIPEQANAYVMETQGPRTNSNGADSSAGCSPTLVPVVSKASSPQGGGLDQEHRPAPAIQDTLHFKVTSSGPDPYYGIDSESQRGYDTQSSTVGQFRQQIPAHGWRPAGGTHSIQHPSTQINSDKSAVEPQANLPDNRNMATQHPTTHIKSDNSALEQQANLPDNRIMSLPAMARLNTDIQPRIQDSAGSSYSNSPSSDRYHAWGGRPAVSTRGQHQVPAGHNRQYTQTPEGSRYNTVQQLNSTSHSRSNVQRPASQTTHTVASAPHGSWRIPNQYHASMPVQASPEANRVWPRQGMRQDYSTNIYGQQQLALQSNAFQTPPPHAPSVYASPSFSRPNPNSRFYPPSASPSNGTPVQYWQHQQHSSRVW